MSDFFYFTSKPANSNVIQAHPTHGIDKLKLIKGEWEGINFPITFKQVYGKHFYDILDTGCAGLFLISEKMKNVLEENQLTGWKVFPIKLFDKKDHEITGYYGLSVIGQSSATSYKKSEILEKRLVPNGPLCKFFKGVFIEKWDGSDFFTPDGTYQTFITRKACEILKKNNITNYYLINLAEKETLTIIVQKSERLNLN